MTAGPMGATVFFCTDIIATAILFWPGSSLKKKTGEHIFLESRGPNIPEKLLWQICSAFGNLSRFGRAARGRATSDIGIHFWLDETRPCEAFDIRDARMGMVFLLSRMTGFNQYGEQGERDEANKAVKET